MVTTYKREGAGKKAAKKRVPDNDTQSIGEFIDGALDRVRETGIGDYVDRAAKEYGKLMDAAKNYGEAGRGMIEGAATTVNMLLTTFDLKGKKRQKEE